MFRCKSNDLRKRPSNSKIRYEGKDVDGNVLEKIPGSSQEVR
jgi:hypothetical protein